MQKYLAIGLAVVALISIDLTTVPAAVAAEADPIPRLNITSRTGEPPGLRRFSVFFAHDSAETSSVTRDLVKRIAATVTTQGGLRYITLTGHTDTVGTRFYNLQLSQQRAMAIKNLLVQNGISDSSLQVYWRGEFELLIPTEDGVAEFRNRRVEILVQ